MQLGEMQLGEMQHFNTTPLGEMQFGEMQLSREKYMCFYNKLYLIFVFI